MAKSVPDLGSEIKTSVPAFTPDQKARIPPPPAARLETVRLPRRS